MTRNVILVAALLVLLSGCGATLETMTLHPARLQTFFTLDSDHANFTCFPTPPFVSACPPITTATGYQLIPGQMTVGYSSVYDAGTLPCPCFEWAAHATRGAVSFDLTKLPKKFATATLILVPTDVNRIEGSSVLANEAGTITGIFLSQAPWGGPAATVTTAEGIVTGADEVGAFGPEPVPWMTFPENPGSTFPASGSPVRKVGQRYEIDATSQFKAWINGSEANHGFAFVGQNESLPDKEKSNQAWKASYKVFLDVVYNPDQQ